MKNQKRQITWVVLAFMCFSTLWGFGNVVNGFIYFNGTQVIFPWTFMFIFYLFPYAFMVGELGSAFKERGGGVASWVQKTSSAKLAYYAGWTYWAVHISYIASKGSGGLKALSWILFQNAETYDSIPGPIVQAATLVVFLFFCWVASRGLNPLKNLTSIAGTSMFVMSILFFIMMFAAPKINPNANYLSVDLNLSNLMPKMSLRTLSNLSILVFAVGGIEKVSPYINNMKGNPAKGFPRAMKLSVLMVVICAVFGTIALAMMFNPAVINQSPESFDSYLANGAYWAFQRLGNYYGVGNLFLIIYAICNLIGQFAVLVISIDAPLRMLLDDPDTSKFIPKGLLKKNKYGAFINGIKLIIVLCSAIIVAQIFVPGAATVIKQLTKLNSIIEPFRYLWIFFAYIMLRKHSAKYPREYKFVKSDKVGIAIAVWMFVVTLLCCILGMISDDPFQMMLNIITPLVLFALGIILPVIRKIQDSKRI